MPIKKKTRRLHLPTLRIDPDTPVSFRFGLKKYRGFAGDTIATALFARGIRIFSRSRKFRRPRGLYSLDGESANCLLNVNGFPNVHAETTPLQPKMRVRPQNRRYSLKRKFITALDRFDSAMPAGFYLRRFHKPRFLWPYFRKHLRRAAGIGQLKPNFRPPDRYEHLHVNAEVCVIGGGPAGMLAALAAAAQGLRVILLESRPWPGGHFDYRITPYREDILLFQRMRTLAEQVENVPGIRIFLRTAATGLYPDHQIMAVQTGTAGDPFDQRLIRINARSIVTATGCRERPLLFEHNDRPGVMQPETALRLARTYGILPGARAVFCVGHDDGLAAAVDLHDLGLTVQAVADLRTGGQNPALVEALAAREIPLLNGWTVLSARGKTAVEGVTLASPDGKETRGFKCDLLAASAGKIPAAELLTSAGAETAFGPGGEIQIRNLPPHVHTAGTLAGYDLADAIELSGQVAGLRAAADCGASVEADILTAKNALDSLPQKKPDGMPFPIQKTGKKVFVCFDMDVTVKEVRQACDLGFDRPELVKRLTGAGTGPGQGGMPGYTLPPVIAACTGKPVEEMQPSRVRPPVAPLLLATCATGHTSILKQSPAFPVQKKLGGLIQPVNGWEIAVRYSPDRAARSGIDTVRQHIGITDISTPGKFRIFGPDAEKALRRIFLGDLAGMVQGEARFGLMCSEQGWLMDRNLIARQGETDYFFITAPSLAAETVREWLDRHTAGEGWNFHLTALTDAMGGIRLAGPRTRELLQRLTESNVSNAAFPVLGYRRFRIRDEITVHAIRNPDLGEITCDLFVPASRTGALWEILIDAGRDLGIQPFGLTAETVLRLEKGVVNLHFEADRHATPVTMGLGEFLFRTPVEPGTVGLKVLREGSPRRGRARWKRVGFRMIRKEEGGRVPSEGAIVADDAVRGRISQCRYSPTLDAYIGTALVEESLTAEGTSLPVFAPDMQQKDDRLSVMVVPMPFYDPDNARAGQ